jgi:hypothetical protein
MASKTRKWITEDGKPIRRTSDRRNNESRSQRVKRHAKELADERNVGVDPEHAITQYEALVILRTGNPLAFRPSASKL